MKKYTNHESGTQGGIEPEAVSKIRRDYESIRESLEKLIKNIDICKIKISEREKEIKEKQSELSGVKRETMHNLLSY